MRTNLKVALGVVAAAVAVGAPAVAHHSFAMFDLSKKVVLQGTVKSLEWRNPHVTLWVEGGATPASRDLWALELTSPGNLTRLGWTKRSLNPGEAVQVEINPLRDGRKGGAFRKATVTSTGQVFTASLTDQVKPK